MMKQIDPCPLPMLGILGGMGPLATVDFLHKVIANTSAHTDQEHIPIIVHNVPQIPDRTEAFLNHTDAPWPALLKGLRMLEEAHVQAVAIPCNTAHLWHARLAAETDLVIFHIGECTAAWLARYRPQTKRVALLATSATIVSRLYHQQFERYGVEVIAPDEGDQFRLVMPAIRAIKAGDISGAQQLLQEAIAHLMRGKVQPQAIVMACTEIPLALRGATTPVDCIDSTDLLAQACVSWWEKAVSTSEGVVA